MTIDRSLMQVIRTGEAQNVTLVGHKTIKLASVSLEHSRYS
jgi:hypothetical protein